MENAAHHQDKEDFNFIKGDIQELDLVKEVVKDIDVVFHEAALTSGILSVKKPIMRAQG